MRDFVNGNIVFIKSLTDDALQQETINESLMIEIQEQMKTILELNVKLMSLKAIEGHTERGLEGCKEQR